MATLTPQQIDTFRDHGYLIMEDAVSPAQLDALNEQFAEWVEQSRTHKKPYGEILDGRPRFDLAPEHTSSKPALRRVNAPTEISDAYLDVVTSSNIPHWIAQLIGPNIKLHHSKINAKLPGSGTKVKWHQDFPFTPHTNDDLITALIMLDDINEDNGPPFVVPGSHQGPIHGLWHDDTFTGAVAEEIANQCQKTAVSCTAPAGSVCLMHTRLLHASPPNHTNRARTLFIPVYSAEDAIPLSPNPVPTTHEGLLVRGKKTNRIRSVPFNIKLPQKPSTASFFDQQAAKTT